MSWIKDSKVINEKDYFKIHFWMSKLGGETKEFDGYQKMFEEALREVTAIERERCAKIAEEFDIEGKYQLYGHAAKEIAKAIREQG